MCFFLSVVYWGWRLIQKLAVLVVFCFGFGGYLIDSEMIETNGLILWMRWKKWDAHEKPAGKITLDYKWVRYETIKTFILIGCKYLSGGTAFIHIYIYICIHKSNYHINYIIYINIYVHLYIHIQLVGRIGSASVSPLHSTPLQPRLLLPTLGTL